MMISRSVFLFMIAQLVFGATSSAQHRCNCSVLISPEFKGKIRLLDSAQRTLQYLRHNFEEEDFVVLHVNGETDDLFSVSAAYAINGHIANGWVKKSSVIGVYSKAYSTNMVLYKMPEKSSAKQIVSGFVSQLLQIISCNDKWAKVSFSFEGKQYVGWLPPEMQCDNPYSACN